MGARRFRAVTSASALFLLTGVGCSEEDAGLTDEQVAAIMSLGPVPELPVDTTNAVADEPAAIDLGHKLFWDPALSGNGQLACASCHLPNKGWAIDDPRSTGSTSMDGMEAAGQSNVHSQTIINCGYQPFMFWNGRGDSLWQQARGALLNDNVHNLTEDELQGVMAKYQGEYDAIFGDTALEAHSPRQVSVNVGKLIAAYERQIYSSGSRLDDWIAGDDAALSEQELRGAALFVDEERGCVSCHSGPQLSDGWFHDIGIESVVDTDADAATGLALLVGADKGDLDEWIASPDNFTTEGPWSDDPAAGRAKLDDVRDALAADPEAFVNAYKTPTLRDVSQRSMLGRTGEIAGPDQVEVLREWIEQYSAGGGVVEPRNYSEAEIDDLIAFLLALDGTNDLGGYVAPPA